MNSTEAFTAYCVAMADGHAAALEQNSSVASYHYALADSLATHAWYDANGRDSAFWREMKNAAGRLAASEGNTR